ncbi:MAG: mannosyltransferase family protein, partial [Thermoleophilia bacterium]
SVRRQREMDPGPSNESPEEADKTGSRLVWWALTVAVASRLFIFAIAVLARSTLAIHRPRNALLTPSSGLYHGVLGRLLNGWTNGDAAWFLTIAQHGYQQRFSQAFFPLYPLLIHLLGGGGRGATVAGIALSLICFLAAALLLYHLTVRLLGARTALWTIVFLALAPTSFFFQAIYSESLFLVLTVALFFFAERRQWLLAGLAGLFATLTRSTGVILAVPLLLFALAAADWQWRRARAGLLAVLLVPAGLLIYMAYLWRTAGNPLLFERAQQHWHRSFTAPYVTLWRGFREGYRGVIHVVTHDSFAHLTASLWQTNLATVNLANFLTLIVVGALIVLVWRRLSAAYTVYALLALLFALVSPARGQSLMSLPRLALVIFPLYMALAAATVRRPVLRVLIVGVFLIGLTWLTSRFVVFTWVA